MIELVWLCAGVLLAGHCWKHSSGQERGQPQPIEGVVAVVEPLEGSHVSGFRVLLRGKISLQNIYLKIQRQLAAADLSVSEFLSPEEAGGDADSPGRN